MAEKIMLSTQELDEQEKTVFSTQELDELDNKVKAAPLRMDAEEPAPWDIDTFIKKVSPVAADMRETDDSPSSEFSKTLAELGSSARNVGYSAAASINRGLAEFKLNLDLVEDYALSKAILPEYRKNKKQQAYGDWELKVAKAFDENKEYWQRKAKENGIGFFEELLGEAFGEAPTGILQFMLDIPYAAALGGATAEKQGKSEFAGIVLGAAERGTLGILFSAMHPFKRYLKTAGTAGLFAGQAAIHGGSGEDIFKASVTGAIYGAATPGGKYGLTEARENITKEYIRKKAAEPKELTKIAEDARILDKEEALYGWIERQPEFKDVVVTGIRQRISEVSGERSSRVFSILEREGHLTAEQRPIFEKHFQDWLETKTSHNTRAVSEGNLSEFPTKPGLKINEPETALVTEARKYKTAEEFVEAQGKTVYHGTPSKELNFGEQPIGNQLPFGVHFQEHIPVAKRFADGTTKVKPTGNEGTIYESIMPKNPLNIDKGLFYEGSKEFAILKEIAEKSKIKDSKYIIQYKGKTAIDPMSIFWKRGQQAKLDVIKDVLKNNGYDQAIVYGMKGTVDPLGVGAPHYTPAVAILDKGLIKTKADLTSIWNKAQEGKAESSAFAPDKDFRRQPESAEATSEITRRSDLVRFLNEKLDIPIRTGKFHDKALGIFKLKEEVARTKQANDIEVIAHEVGHGLQKFLWPESIVAEKGAAGMSNKPFTPYSKELNPIATKPRANQPAETEGFAEFVRLYITNPVKAQEVAPRFYKFFEAELKSKSPETLDILKEASAHYDRWLKQPALQRVLSQVSIGEKESRSKSLDDVYTAMVDELYPLKKIVETVAKGEKLPISSDPYSTARLTRGSDGKAETFLKHSPFKYDTYADVGKSMKDILKPVQNRIDEFVAYSVARQARAMEKQGKETGILKKDAEEVIKQFDEDLSKPFKEMSEFRQHRLNYLKDSGIGTPEMYAKLEKMADDYVPLFRVMDKEAKDMGAGKGFEAKQPIKRRKGSARDIINPLESDIKNTFAYIHAAEKNAVGLALVKLGESREGMGKFIEKIPRPMKEIKLTKEEKARLGLEDVPDGIVSIFRPSDTYGENVISVWNKGKQEFYEVHPDIARVFKALDKEGSNMLVRVLSKPASWLRAGATLTPEFVARNPVRDQITAFVYSKYGYLPMVDLTRGIFSMAKKDKMYWDWKKSGGDHSMLVSMDRNYLQDNLGELLSKYPVANRIKNPMEALRILSELGEQGTRIGEFKKGVKKEGATKEGMQKAALAAREVTLDFNKKGTIGKSVNMITAFWNAQIQGMDKMVRAFKENPGGATLRTALAITLPSVLLAIGTHDDERIKELPAWQRDLFWCVPVGDTIYRIPKPFELGVLFGSFPERITHWILNQDPHAFDGLLKSIVDAAAPGFVPTAAIPIMENWANKSIFFDRPIVPPSRTDVLPEYQYGPHTTETAKALGKLFGRLPFVDDLVPTSPAYIENLIRGWTGGLGQHALNIMDWSLTQAGLSSIDYEKPSSTLSDIPLIKAFIVRYPSANTASITRFYDNYNKSQQTLNTVNALLMKEGKPDEALRLMESSPMDDLSGFYSTIRDQHKLIDAIYSNPMMTGDEKREYIDMIYMQMIGIAQRGNEIIDSMEKQRKELKRAQETRVTAPTATQSAGAPVF